MDKIDIRDLIVRALKENEFFTLDYKDDDIKGVKSDYFVNIAETIVENLPIYVVMQQRELLLAYTKQVQEDNELTEEITFQDVNKFLANNSA